MKEIFGLLVVDFDGAPVVATIASGTAGASSLAAGGSSQLNYCAIGSTELESST